MLLKPVALYCADQKATDDARQANTISLWFALQGSTTRNKLLKDELLRCVDRYGKQLPSRLLASVLIFNGSQEVARSQRVCTGWRLAAHLLDRLWKALYATDYEQKTADCKAIAVDGADTSWCKRYERRKRTEANWRAGRCNVRNVDLPFRPVALCVGPSSIVIVGGSQGSLLAMDMCSGTILAQSTLGEPDGEEGRILGLAQHGEGVFVSGGRNAGIVQQRRLSDLTLCQEYATNYKTPIPCKFAAIDTDGKRLVGVTCGSLDKDLVVWDVDSGDILVCRELMWSQMNLSKLAVDWTRHLVYVGWQSGIVHKADIVEGNRKGTLDMGARITSIIADSSADTVLVTAREKLYELSVDEFDSIRPSRYTRWTGVAARRGARTGEVLAAVNNTTFGVCTRSARILAIVPTSDIGTFLDASPLAACVSCISCSLKIIGFWPE